VSLVLVGLNHKATPIEIREKFSFSDSVRRAALEGIVDNSVIEEGVILSTCNRTEIYCCGSTCEEVVKKSKNFLTAHGDLELTRLQEFLYEFKDDEAVLHLFDVACGLDSMIVGEGQILSQVKSAFTESRELGFTGAVLNKLFDGAIRAGKRARSETAICQGASSISFAAVELARKIFGDLKHCRILLVGAGKMSELTVRLLVNEGVEVVMVANRAAERAREIAGTYGGRVIPFEDLSLHLQYVDVIISSTSAPHFVLTGDRIAAGMKARRGLPLFIVDIAVPRDVEPLAGKIDNVYLYNIDDLKDAVNQNLVERCNEINSVKAIIEEEYRRFSCFMSSRAVVPLIRCFRGDFESTAQAELEKVIAKNSLSEKEKRLLRTFCSGLVQKLLHRPTVKLKEMSGDQVDRNTLEVLRQVLCESCDEENTQ